ncbi:prolyl oligopeptidase family serine peptidase [Peristeroidobacter soli]|uniref:prolyl oligopeptidase family serine peptidase n=1 Tax=Peristeroidobacter soli TaxID=2497877 RepID=UPI00101C09B5|nr:prolyl oligopeptidase family serine peptidase [Peristeroidobacter soli]
MLRVQLAALLFLPMALGASTPEKFTLEEAIAAHRSMDDWDPPALIATPRGKFVAWSDGKNLFVALPPEFKPAQATSHTDNISLGQIVASPDGHSIFYTRGRKQPAFGPHPERDTRELWQMDVDRGDSKRLASGADVPSGAMSFAKDGRAFAFADGNMLWEFRQQAAGWTRRPLLQNNAEHYAAVGIDDIVYSPDGARVAFSSIRKAGQRYIGVVDLQTLAHRYLAPGVFADLKPSWSQDGKQLVFMRIPANHTMAYRFSEYRTSVPWSLELADPGSGAVRTLWRADPGIGSAPPPDLIAPIWARDRILFVWEKTGWQLLYSIPTKGGTATLLTPGEGEVTAPVLSATGDSVVYESNIGDLPRQHVWKLSLEGGRPQRVTSGQGVDGNVRLTSDGALVYVANTNGRMPNRRVVEYGKRVITLTPQSEENRKFQKLWDEFVNVEVVPVRADDGVVTHHLMMVPRGQPPKGGYPVIVSSKGGPTGRVAPGAGYGPYTPLGQYAVSRGYIFLEINYRGGSSFGLDYRFPEQRGATGGSEVKDLAALAKYLKSRADVDPKRIGIVGHSYGGHIVGLALSRLPEDYSAGVHMSGVADWVVEMKKDGETADWPSEPPEFIRLSERLKIEDLAFESSSTSHTATWRAPTLFIMGELDTAGHMESVIDLGYRLMERGTPTEFYIVPDAKHGLFPVQRVFDFFERTFGPMPR